MPESSCPSCATPVEFPPEMAGKRFTCMKCDTDFRLPGDPVPPPAPTSTSSPQETPVSPAQQAQLDAMVQAVTIAAVLMVQGTPSALIVKKLMNSGVPAPNAMGLVGGLTMETAHKIVDGMGKAKADALATQLQQEEIDPLRKMAHSNILFGTLWLVGGLLVTGLTLAAAVGSGGGRYVVATGAIIWGAIQLLQGVQQLRSLKT
jgi:hypothetical protein